MYIYDSIVIGEGIYGLYVGIKCLTRSKNCHNRKEKYSGTRNEIGGALYNISRKQ